jgi:hypothetical protein
MAGGAESRPGVNPLRALMARNIRTWSPPWQDVAIADYAIISFFGKICDN